MRRFPDARISRARRPFMGLALLGLACSARPGAVCGEEPSALVPALTAPAAPDAAAPYRPDGDVVVVEISEYAGYAGLIHANGGLDPNPDSVFAREYGFQVKLVVSESEDWSPLNAGRVAAAPTTVDVLAAYGAGLKVRVPVLIGFSRGADGVVADAAVRRINDLKGKRLATCQFTEADFFIRYLAGEASLPVKTLDSLDAPADPGALNLVYAKDAFAAGDLYAAELASGRGRLAGCVTWDPKTTEVAEGSEGKARLLATNRNLLIVADILMVNAGFAAARPEWAAGLARGVLKGNAQVRARPSAAAPALAKAFGWSAEDSERELAKVHLANWPENMAFFDGRIDNAGSFGYLYETALAVYGPTIALGAAPMEAFPDRAALAAANADGFFSGEKAAITPRRASADAQAPVEARELLSKNLYFYFTPNSAKLTDGREAENEEQLRTIRRWLGVAPGSRVLLRGHADGSRLPEIEKTKGASEARSARLTLKALSQERCAVLRDLLASLHGVSADRVETRAVGADEPTGDGPDADRRVEAQWFTLE